MSITKLKNGYEIYIGPKDLDAGGDGLLITLDSEYQLKDYVIERIDPSPY